MLKKHIFLIGFMGVGKSSTSRQLSQLLQVKEIDTDGLIVEQQGKSINDIFQQQGEEAFRQMETRLLEQLKDEEPCIVSCGGGMVMRQPNVAKMKESGTICLLTATPETIYEHVKDSTNRPLLNGNMNIPYISNLMQQREPKYQAAADIIIKTDGHSPRQVAQMIIDKIDSEAVGTQAI